MKYKHNRSDRRIYLLRLGTLILTVLTLVVVMVNLIHTASEVTVIQIEEKLEQIGELATASFTYTGQQRIENTRDFLGLFQIPLTTNHLDITYTGVIKVGYTVSDIGIRVDEGARAICITSQSQKWFGLPLGFTQPITSSEYVSAHISLK